MRRSGIWQTLVAALLTTTIVAARGWAREAPAPVDPMRSDAQLADVTFLDDARGWAVGDRGVIWHTRDGGRTWTLQNSGVDCRLSSVCFLSDKVGWVAGGYTQPYTHASVGVVLHTRDGGQSWSPLRTRVLPAIERVGFFDLEQGWAIGRTSAYFPTGVFTTSDGGKSWSAVPGDGGSAWLAGELTDPNTGALAGGDGAVARLQRRAVEARPSDFGLRALRRMKLDGRSGGWLVGDGGLVLVTKDLGASWQTTPGALPPGSSAHFDFDALAVRNEHCWVAGTPGTRVLHSGDGGTTWQAFDTKQALPLRALAFADELHGWAVGDLGLILATADGGRSWHPQRAGGQRSAFAGFFSQRQEIPLELLAQLAADEGYLGAIEILNRRQSDRVAAAGAGATAHEASVLAGASAGSTAWRFPLRSAQLKLSADQLVDDWNRANDGAALEKIEAHIVSRIRMWRPNVVFTVAGEARDPLALAINQIVLAAVERAADPTRHAEQIAEAGLQPWKVQKVYAALADGTGTSTINTAQVTARLGRSIGELAAPARGLVSEQYVPPRANVGFRLLVDQIPQDVGKRDFFSGIVLAPGGEARRAYEPSSRNNLEAARREAQRFRNLQAILAQADQNPSDGHFLANISDQTRDLEPRHAAEVLFQLAERYWIRGRWELAAECYEVLVERHADHPLVGAALVWLVQYYASGEAAWRSRAGQHDADKLATAPAALPSSAPRAVKEALGLGVDEPDATNANFLEQGGLPTAGSVIQAGGLSSESDSSGRRWEKAAGYGQQLEQAEPSLALEPRARFPLAVAQRRRGYSGDATRAFQAMVRNRPTDGWQAAAATELWLANPEERPPKPLWNCARAAGKPRLDGKLDEPLWHAANVVELRSPLRDDAEWGAVAMLAYDDEFLYVGLSCSRAVGFRYQQSDQPRSRDADLSDHDRVELVLDVDRDFATYYVLSIDERGWTGERCWHDATWDPAWYVAAGGDERAWTAEAAIPLAELSGERPDGDTAWAVGVQRIVPGVGFQSWTTPAAPEIDPEGFGYLIFIKP